MAKRVVVKKKVVKKSASTSSPVGGRGPAAPYSQRARKSYADEEGEGITFGGIIMLLITVAIVAGIVFIFIPRDISSVKGYPYDKSKVTGTPKNLLRQMEDQFVQKKGSIRFTEAEVNNYLNQRLATEQGGLLGGVMNARGLYADLEPDKVTFYIERELFGLPIIIGSSWQVFQSDQGMVRNCTSTSVGRLEVPIAFDPLLQPFRKVAVAMQREFQLLFDKDARNLKLEQDAISLDVIGE